MRTLSRYFVISVLDSSPHLVEFVVALPLLCYLPFFHGLFCSMRAGTKSELHIYMSMLFDSSWSKSSSKLCQVLHSSYMLSTLAYFTNHILVISCGEWPKGRTKPSATGP